jgi:hypothetical protein
VNDDQLYAQALALQQTAETMVKTGDKTAVEVTTHRAAEALVQAAKQLKPGNPVIAALTVRTGITWPEVLTIANAIRAS